MRKQGQQPFDIEIGDGKWISISNDGIVHVVDFKRQMSITGRIDETDMQKLSNWIQDPEG